MLAISEFQRSWVHSQDRIFFKKPQTNNFFPMAVQDYYQLLQRGGGSHEVSRQIPEFYVQPWCELKLELQQAQSAQKPVFQAEVYASAWERILRNPPK